MEAEAVSIIQVRDDNDGVSQGSSGGGVGNGVHSLILSTTQQSDSYF